MFVNTKGDLLAQVCYAVSALLYSLYGLQLKWEKLSKFVTWGVVELAVTEQGVSMCRKGVVRTLTNGLLGREWERWVPRDSSNARFTMKSVLVD